MSKASTAIEYIRSNLEKFEELIDDPRGLLFLHKGLDAVVANDLSVSAGNVERERGCASNLASAYGALVVSRAKQIINGEINTTDDQIELVQEHLETFKNHDLADAVMLKTRSKLAKFQLERLFAEIPQHERERILRLWADEYLLSSSMNTYQEPDDAGQPANDNEPT